jgi:hypothetical protein
VYVEKATLLATSDSFTSDVAYKGGGVYEKDATTSSELVRLRLDNFTNDYAHAGNAVDLAGGTLNATSDDFVGACARARRLGAAPPKP